MLSDESDTLCNNSYVNWLLMLFYFPVALHMPQSLIKLKTFYFIVSNYWLSV